MTAPWHTLLGITGLYLLSIPASVLSYRKVKRARLGA